ncbi:hypothetical protein [Cellulomonas sp. S1-8]|uniref:CIS tube protein n=1 Tax=Cellulomonas sp. S1-8 TaxID=2904790 RepID=UPI00224460AF|nr:hypothetical protein [Cellulomonas sp. S1-8]UZN02563.1 hypothetical protein OKX07_16100 [Cellulomonas sp. S1-8]
MTATSEKPTENPTPAVAMLAEKDRPENALHFQFNPTTIAFTRPVQYNRTPRQADDPPVQFTGAGPTTLTLQLLLDAGRRGVPSVQPELDLLASWTTVPDVTTPGDGPPTIAFTWGELAIAGDRSLVGNISQLKVTVELFDRQGRPLRALVDLTLVSAKKEPKGTNPTSGAERSRLRHVLRRGETLQSVAWSRLDDPGAWRAVAELNGIDDPTRMRVGRELLLPDAQERGALGLRRGASGTPSWLADGSRP